MQEIWVCHVFGLVAAIKKKVGPQLRPLNTMTVILTIGTPKKDSQFETAPVRVYRLGRTTTLMSLM